MSTTIEAPPSGPEPELGPAARRRVGPGAWTALAVGVVLAAGVLFGYDQGVISGALRGIQTTFSVSTLVTEVITSWVTLGAMVGALCGGLLADGVGRRAALIGAAVLFAVGAAVEALAPGAGILVVGRLVVGHADGRGRHL